VTRCTHPCQKSNSAAVEGRKRGGETEIGLWDKGTCGDKVWTIKRFVCRWAIISFLRVSGSNRRPGRLGPCMGKPCETDWLTNGELSV
jgi:hypothetical protein